MASTPNTLRTSSGVRTSAGAPEETRQPEPSTAMRSQTWAARLRSCRAVSTVSSDDAQEGQQLDLVPYVQVVGGLVEDQDAGLLDEGARDEYALALASGQGQHAAVREVGDVQPVHRLPAQLAFASGQWLVAACVRSAAEGHHLLDGEVEFGVALLGQGGDRAGAVAQLQRGQVGAVEQDGPGGRASTPGRRSAGRWTCRCRWARRVRRSNRRPRRGSAGRRAPARPLRRTARATREPFTDLRAGGPSTDLRTDSRAAASAR